MPHTNGQIDPADGVSFAGWPRNEVKLFLQTVGRFVAAQTKPLQDRIAELETQVAELQAGGVKFSGTYQRGNEYKRGEMCAYDGSIWCALTDTKPLQIPGKDAVWQLAVRGQSQARPPTKGGARPAQPEHRPKSSPDRKTLKMDLRETRAGRRH